MEADRNVVAGRARVDRRTKDLVKRLRPGEIAVIDHEDLDRIAAEGLVAARAGAIVNASRSISGRYPNTGPLLVASAGIPLVDGVGAPVMEAIRDGADIVVDGADVRVGGRIVAQGVRQDTTSLAAAVEAARRTMGVELERFAENTLEYLRQERHLLTDSPELPKLRTDVKGRHVLIVVRGWHYREDLNALRGYIREERPVLIAVDGGAEALVEAGFQPDVVVGDFDSVRDETLRRGAELIVHAYPGGRAPGAERLDALGLEYHVFEGAGTSEDIAMLMAYELGAELIVAVGTHASMVEFLDKGRAGMASTFLVRLKVSDKLHDAKGVSRLYQGSRLRRRDLALLVLSALLTMLIVIAISPTLRLFVRSTWDLVR